MTVGDKSSAAIDAATKEWTEFHEATKFGPPKRGFISFKRYREITGKKKERARMDLERMVNEGTAVREMFECVSASGAKIVSAHFKLKKKAAR